MLGRTRDDDLAFQWINWMRFQFLIKLKWTSDSTRLHSANGNRIEGNRRESNARGIELRISNRTDDDDSTTLAIILDLCVSCWYTSIRARRFFGCVFFRPFAINNYGDRLLFALTVRVFGQLRFLLFAGLPASPSVYLSKCPTVHGKVNAGPLWGTPSVCQPLSFCILKAISSEFFGIAICFCFSYPPFWLLFWPAIFNNKSKSKKIGTFVWFAALFVVVTGTKQKRQRRQTLIIATDYKIPWTTRRLPLILRFSWSRKLSF